MSGIAARQNHRSSPRARDRGASPTETTGQAIRAGAFHIGPDIPAVTPSGCENQSRGEAHTVGPSPRTARPPAGTRSPRPPVPAGSPRRRLHPDARAPLAPRQPHGPHDARRAPRKAAHDAVRSPPPRQHSARATSPRGPGALRRAAGQPSAGFRTDPGAAGTPEGSTQAQPLYRPPLPGPTGRAVHRPGPGPGGARTLTAPPTPRAPTGPGPAPAPAPG